MKWLKILLLSSPLFICVLGLLGLSENANAVSVTSNIYSTAVYTKNFESTDTRISIGPVSTPFASIDNIYNPTGFWDYTQALSFPNPYSNHVGTGFDSALYFTITAGDVNYPLTNENLGRLMANMKLGFEGLSNSSPYCSSSWKINNYTRNSIQFLLMSSCPYGSFPANTDFDEVEAYIDFKPDSMFWCANDNPTHHCPASISVSISKIDYYFGILTEANSDSQTIINQNQTIINQMEATNDWLTDTTAPSADTSTLGNAAGWLPPGPLDSILNLPIQFIQGIIGVFTNTNTCSPIVLPLGLINYNLEIPCMRPFFELASVNIVWNTVGTIISAILIFHTLKWLYKFVDDTLSFRENNSNMWGGL